MRCRLDKGEPIAPGLRRIAREQLEKALREISGTARRDEGAAVHATRKHIKRTRALLRLVRRELDSELFAGENERLRAVANGFSGSRDARVQLQVVEKLREDPKAFSETIAALEKEVASCEEAFGKHRQKAVSTLQQICDRIEGWPLDSVGGDALCDAVQRSYRHGRKCFHGLCDDPVSEDFHSWRKRVKDFWYQAQILQNLNRTILCEMADAAKSLGQQLGDLHDLAFLRHRLETRHEFPDEERAFLLGAIRARDSGLQEIALDLGARFHAEKPGALGRRLRRYAERWEAALSLS